MTHRLVVFFLRERREVCHVTAVVFGPLPRVSAGLGYIVCVYVYMCVCVYIVCVYVYKYIFIRVVYNCYMNIYNVILRR